MMDSGRIVNAPQDSFAPERAVRRLLESYNVDISQILLGAFTLFVAQIDKFKYRPNDEIDGRPLRRAVTDRDMNEMKKRGLQQQARRRVLNQAADILEQEIDDGRWRAVPGLKEHVRRWEEAIVVLRMPRGVTDTPRHWLHVAKTGSPMRPWAYMATEIAGALIGVLRAHGVKTSLRHTSPVPKLTLEDLKFIGVETLPAITTLSKVLRKNLSDITEP